ncbi:2615_t:CDS:2 [Scutellospora calospora]|uniref:2615_t:CDS:1 n=1 Tax=Scutellospora calospora TaxID=85575 RepID=A0ACA9K412_9GLOM|nr:2615_t:CDS:2 [Scutellospora calospora]
MQSEEWKIVQKKKTRQPTINVSPMIKKNHNFQYLNRDSKKKVYGNNVTQISSKDVIYFIEEKMKALNKSVFFKELKEMIYCQFLPPNRPTLVDIVCYGIGSIEKSNKSQYQFALMLLFKNIFQITGKVYAYDPVLSQVDIEVLTHYNVESIKINEKAKRIVTNQTLFYMPHCPLGLYNNLIKANWDRIKLKDIIIVGNRLEFYTERTTAFLESKAPYIIPISFLMILQSLLFPSTTITIPDNIFNDLCCQWFPIDKVDAYERDSEFWILKQELDEDPEII